MSGDDRSELGISPGASVFTSHRPAPEGWEVDEIGVAVTDVPPRPWPWPYGIIRHKRSGRPIAVVQMWRRSYLRAGFSYSVLWHPDRGRTYRVESTDPDFRQQVKDAQRLFRRETRGRKRHRPTPEQFIADRKRIRRASGVAPSTSRMADEYDVTKETVERWLRRSDWAAVRQDK